MPADAGRPIAEADLSRRTRRRTVGLVAALVAAVALSLFIGANPIELPDVWRVLWSPDGSEASSVVWTYRVPRTAVGLLVGVCFGVAGALIQALTRNPLADPGILGVNAGAAFAVTLGVGFFGLTDVTGYIWFAFLGAAAATVLVHLIGSAGREPATPVALVLAGVALGAVLGGFTSLLTLFDEQTFLAIRDWGLGSLARIGLDETGSVVPFFIAGLVLTAVVAGPLNLIALGDDLAASLGARVQRTRILTVVAVTLLAGTGTALTGGIGFVGLMVPHVVRWFTGPDQRLVLVYSALAAPVLVLVADVVGRVLGRPGEVEVGIVTAVLGAPVLIALVRRRKASGL